MLQRFRCFFFWKSSKNSFSASRTYSFEKYFRDFFWDLLQGLLENSFRRLRNFSKNTSRISDIDSLWNFHKFLQKVRSAYLLFKSFSWDSFLNHCEIFCGGFSENIPKMISEIMFSFENFSQDFSKNFKRNSVTNSSTLFSSSIWKRIMYFLVFASEILLRIP